ncbi:MAG: hypothetical protein Q9223_001134 [Gallowayella weberi]
MSEDRTPISFGERGTGEYSAPLPFRYLSVDGRCAVDIAHTAGIQTDIIAPIEIKIATRLVISTCVVATKRGEANTGGLLTGLGRNQALAIRVMSSKPNTTCGPEDSAPPWESCRDIIDSMPANNKRQVFGPRDDPRTTVPLPWRYTARQRCRITVDLVDWAEPRSITESDWYKVWAATNEVHFMCIQQGKRGDAGIVGDNKLLKVEIKDEIRESKVASYNPALSWDDIFLNHGQVPARNQDHLNVHLRFQVCLVFLYTIFFYATADVPSANTIRQDLKLSALPDKPDRGIRLQRAYSEKPGVIGHPDLHGLRDCNAGDGSPRCRCVWPHDSAQQSVASPAPDASGGTAFLFRYKQSNTTHISTLEDQLHTDVEYTGKAMDKRDSLLTIVRILLAFGGHTGVVLKSCYVSTTGVTAEIRTIWNATRPPGSQQYLVTIEDSVKMYAGLAVHIQKENRLSEMNVIISEIGGKAEIARGTIRTKPLPPKITVPSMTNVTTL